MDPAGPVQPPQVQGTNSTTPAPTGLAASQASSTSSFQGSVLSYSLAPVPGAERGTSDQGAGGHPDREGGAGPHPGQPGAGDGEPPVYTLPAGALPPSSSNSSLTGLGKHGGSTTPAPPLPPRAPAPGASQFNSRRFASYDLQVRGVSLLKAQSSVPCSCFHDCCHLISTSHAHVCTIATCHVGCSPAAGGMLSTAAVCACCSPAELPRLGPGTCSEGSTRSCEGAATQSA
jgi:hypothetical protein